MHIANSITVQIQYMLYLICSGMEEFYSYKEITLQKRQSRETKYNTTKKNIYITMYNYKLYTIARLVPNKSIQAVQLIY